ncbi:MAG: MFS transporter [Spirochaetales bacterium]|nr:MFS transporter [Spirochaetales bacterium]
MKNLKANLALYGFGYFFIFGALATLIPFFPLVLQSKGLAPSRIGFLLGSYELFSIIGLMVIGHFYDRFRSPRRTIFTICFLAALTLYLISSTASVILLITLTLALGFVVKSPSALLDAHYGQIVPNAEKSYGKIRLFGSIGYSLTALGIQLTGVVDPSRPLTVFYVYLLMIVSTMIVLPLLPRAEQHRTEHKGPSFMTGIRSFPRVYWIGLIIAFFNQLGMSGHYTFFSLLISNKFGRSDVGGLWAVGPVLEIPLFFFSTYLLRKLGIRTLWIIGLASGFIRMQVYSLAGGLLPLYLVQLIHSAAFGFNHLCIVTLITRYVAPDNRGMAMSLYSALGLGLSLFVGGFLGGWVLEMTNYTVLFQILSLFPVLGIATSAFFLKSEGDPEPSPAAG